NHHRLDAYGAPVVAIREQQDAVPPRREPFVPPQGAIAPATVTLRFDEGDSVVLEMWNPDHATTITRHGAPLRLSIDTTAPIAELFARAELVRRGHRGLTNVQEYVSRIGIYIHEPFDPEKIPVVMVHGLRSSPATWRDMLNDLRADATIRDRFQFWMFYYPSGLPIPRSAAYLRRALHDVRRHFDPAGEIDGLRDMVLLGHSMGGLLSKAQVQASGTTMWHSLHPTPFDQLDLPDALRAHLEEVFFYEADPDISRIVFIATPHCGSSMADGWIGRFGDALVELPDEFDDVDVWFAEERRSIDVDDTYQLGRGVPSSIDDLREDAPHLNAYLALPLRAGLPYHSIAGDNGGGSDGVVPVESALLPGAVSALVVESGHDAHMAPLAIREVRRILLEHLRSIDERQR
ncbi:MAG: hypothetical protein AAFX05_14975, partial [Planctomycetota bacterium]